MSLVTLIVLVVVLFLVLYLVDLLPADMRGKKLIKGLIIALFIIYLLEGIGAFRSWTVRWPQ